MIPKSFFTRIKRNGPALQAHDDILYRNRKTQDSWSQRLLCDECEQKLSQWESYAIDVLRRPGRRKVMVRKAPTSWEFFNVDYDAFRLFQLSVLFRAAESSRIEYEHVSLPGRVIERMRYLLNSSQAPDENEFPCLMEAIRSPANPDELFTQVIGAPRTLPIDDRMHYWFVFGGFCWYFVFPRLNREQLSYHSYMHRGGWLKVPVLELHEHPLLLLAAVTTALKSEAGWEI